MFYPNGKKIIPKNVVNRLTPLGLAMWYADDGTTILVGKNDATGSARSRRIEFCTDCFTIKELDQTIEELKQINISASLLKRKKDVYRIKLNDFEKQTFLLQIAPYFYNYFPSLLYKMDLGYRNESLKNRRYVLEDYHNLYIKISAHPDFLDRMENR